MRAKHIMTLSAFSLAASIGAAKASDEGLLAGYEKTGETTRCIPLTQLRGSDPVDDTAMLFELRNGEMYLNELRGKCIGLKRNDRYSFQTTQNQICVGDVIVISNRAGTVPLGSCGLGEFEALAEIPADAET
ncbi:MAG: DUF6491 family protein [Hyphococcus sp.]